MLRRLATLVCSLAIAAGALAQDVQPVPPLAGRVIDKTATLNAAQVQALDARLAAIEQERGSQIVVLMVASSQPEDIAAYAQRVADTWKIGRRQTGDGVLIVVAKNDRRVRIEVAKALEGAIPDLAASRIINESITPAFKVGDYARGLAAGVERIAERIGAEGLPAPDASRPAAQRASSSGFDWQDLAIFLFVGAPIVGAVLTGVLGRKLGALATGGVVGGVGWWLTASLLMGGAAALLALILVGVVGIGSRAGSGLVRRGGPAVWGGAAGGAAGGWGGGRGGGGGGFSSGGGGDFGGGGASGSW